MIIPLALASVLCSNVNPVVAQGSRGGFVFNHNPDISTEEEKIFRDDLAGIRVLKIIGKGESGRLMAWKPSGDFESTEDVEHIADKVELVKLWVLVEYPHELRSGDGKGFDESTKFFRNDRFRNNIISGSGDFAKGGFTTKTWFVVSKPKERFFKIDFQVVRTEETGIISKEIGHKQTIGTTSFEVASFVSEKSDGEWKETVGVRTSNTRGSLNFHYFPRVDWASFERDFGNSRVRYCHSTMSEDGFVADKPYQYWKDIVVVRKTSFSGSFLQLASEPRISPSSILNP